MNYSIIELSRVPSLRPNASECLFCNQYMISVRIEIAQERHEKVKIMNLIDYLAQYRIKIYFKRRLLFYEKMY